MGTPIVKRFAAFLLALTLLAAFLPQAAAAEAPGAALRFESAENGSVQVTLLALNCAGAKSFTVDVYYSRGVIYGVSLPEHLLVDGAPAPDRTVMWDLEPRAGDMRFSVTLDEPIPAAKAASFPLCTLEVWVRADRMAEELPLSLLCTVTDETGAESAFGMYTPVLIPAKALAQTELRSPAVRQRVYLRPDRVENERLYVTVMAEHCLGESAFDLDVFYDRTVLSPVGGLVFGGYLAAVTATGKPLLHALNKEPPGRLRFNAGLPFPVPESDAFADLLQTEGVAAEDVNTDLFEIGTLKFKLLAPAETTDLTVTFVVHDDEGYLLTRSSTVTVPLREQAETSENTEPGPEPAFPPERLGDVNGDGDVTAADARLALRKAVSLEAYAPGSVEFYAADVDADGAVTATDARILLRVAVKLERVETYLPAP